MSANPPRTFYTTKNIKCPTRYLPPSSRFCQRTLSQTIPQYSGAQSIYMIIRLSLRSFRRSLSRQQGIILIKTANAVTLPFFSKYTINRKQEFFGKTGIFESNTRIERERNGMLLLTTGVWHKRGIVSSESATKQQVMWLVASVCKPRLRQALARLTNLLRMGFS